MGRLAGRRARERTGLVRKAKVGAKIEAQALSACVPAAVQCGDRHVSLRMVVGAIIPWTITRRLGPPGTRFPAAQATGRGFSRERRRPSNSASRKDAPCRGADSLR